MLNVNFKFDDSLTLTWECAGIKPFIESISFLHELPKLCPICNAPVHFFYRNPQGNSYYGLRCEGGPAHESNMGQHKPPLETLYYKGDESWELEYSAREGGNNQSPPAQPGSAASSQPVSQPSQPAPSASPKSDKAPMEELLMVAPVARNKGVKDIEGLSMTMFSKPTADLTSGEVKEIITYMKTL